MSDEDKARFPKAAWVEHLSGQVKVGDAVKKVEIRRGINSNKTEVALIGTVDGKPMPTDITQQVYEKYLYVPSEREPRTPTEHYGSAKRANEERDLGITANEEPWKGLL